MKQPNNNAAIYMRLVVDEYVEPIISKSDFEKVQGQIASRRRERKEGTTQIFAGLVKCADCDWSLSFGTNKQNRSPYSYYHCSRYGAMGKNHSSSHYIRYDTLYTYVLSRIQFWSNQAYMDEEKLLKKLMSVSDKETGIICRKQENDLRQAEKRKTEVDALFARLYEDWAVGRITEYNFNMLSAKYQDEQTQLDEQIEELRAKLDKVKQTTADAGKWLALIRKYANPMELTAPLLNTLIEKIVVHEADKHEDGTREQKVEIYYRFIGKID